MHFDVLSLFPEYFQGPLSESIVKRAQEKGLITIELTNIRDYAKGKHKRVDDRLYGGGRGMLLMPGPVIDAVRAKKQQKSHVIAFSPKGKKLTTKRVQELAKEPHLILVCGHYEGIDQRAVDTVVDELISIGDYILTNGALAACVFIDAVSRFVPGVLSEEAVFSESFENSLLEGPQYTRPEIFEGQEVPKVLLEGDHKKIEAWRLTQAIEITKKERPDLYLAWSTRKKNSFNEKLRVGSLNRITLYTKSCMLSAKFYKSLFGKERVEQSAATVVVDIGSVQLEFIEKEMPTASTFHCVVDEKAMQQLKRNDRDGKGFDIKNGYSTKDPDENQWFFSLKEK